MKRCTGAVLAVVAVLTLLAPPTPLSAQKKTTPKPPPKAATKAAPRKGASALPAAACPIGCWRANATRGTASLFHKGEVAIFSDDPGTGYSQIGMQQAANDAGVGFVRSAGGLPAQGKYQLGNGCPDNDKGPPKGALLLEYRSSHDPGRQGLAFSRSGELVIESSTKARIVGHYTAVLCYMDHSTGTIEGNFDARNPAAGF